MAAATAAVFSHKKSSRKVLNNHNYPLLMLVSYKMDWCWWYWCLPSEMWVVANIKCRRRDGHDQRKWPCHSCHTCHTCTHSGAACIPSQTCCLLFPTLYIIMLLVSNLCGNVLSQTCFSIALFIHYTKIPCINIFFNLKTIMVNL